MQARDLLAVQLPADEDQVTVPRGTRVIQPEGHRDGIPLAPRDVTAEARSVEGRTDRLQGQDVPGRSPRLRKLNHPAEQRAGAGRACGAHQPLSPGGRRWCALRPAA